MAHDDTGDRLARSPEDTQLEDSLKTAHRIMVGLHGNDGFKKVIAREQSELVQRGGKMDRPRFFRHAADWAARTHMPALSREGQLTREHVLAQLIFSAPDAVITEQRIPDLEVSDRPVDTVALMHSKRRLARFDMLLQEVINSYPEMPVSTLIGELDAGYEVTGSKDASDLARAHRLLKNRVLNARAALNIADMMSRDEDVTVQWGSLDQRVAGAALVAHIDTHHPRQDGNTRILTIGINPHHSVDSLEDARIAMGEPHDPNKACTARTGQWLENGQVQPFVRVDAFSMLKPDDLADDWYAPETDIDDLWAGFGQSIRQAVTQQGLDKFAS